MSVSIRGGGEGGGGEREREIVDDKFLYANTVF